jgi:hypothetical protein
MLQAMLVRVSSSLRQRVRTLFHRTDALDTEAADRRERWNQVMTRPKNPPGAPAGTSTSSSPRR